HREQHGDKGRNHGAVNRRQRAEILGYRIPALAGEKTKTERLERRYRTFEQRKNPRAEQDQDTYRGGARQLPKRSVAEPQPVKHFSAAAGRGRDQTAFVDSDISHGLAPRRFHQDAPLPEARGV